MVEYDTSLSHVTLVDFESNYTKQQYHVFNITRISMKVFDRVDKGGLRLCSDSCKGVGNESALRCMTERNGEQNCYNESDVEEARDKLPDDYGDLFDVKRKKEKEKERNKVGVKVNNGGSGEEFNKTIMGKSEQSQGQSKEHDGRLDWRWLVLSNGLFLVFLAVIFYVAGVY